MTLRTMPHWTARRWGEQPVFAVGRLTRAVHVLLAGSVFALTRWLPRGADRDGKTELGACGYPIPNIRTGDVVVIEAQTPRARLLRRLYPRFRYTHIGICVVDEGTNRVVHTIPSGPQGAGVYRESPEQFVARAGGGGVSWFRLNTDPERGGVAGAAAHRYWKEQIPFDWRYALWKEDALFCSELVWWAYMEAGVDLLDGSFYRTRVLGLPFASIFPDQIAESGYLTRLDTER